MSPRSVLDGKPLWEQRAGVFNPKRYEYGYAPSPVMYRQTVIIAAEHDGDSYMVALDRASGKEVLAHTATGQHLVLDAFDSRSGWSRSVDDERSTSSGCL